MEKIRYQIQYILFAGFKYGLKILEKGILRKGDSAIHWVMNCIVEI
jgi:hypothetical protein